MDIDFDITGFDEKEREEIALWTPNGDEGNGKGKGKKDRTANECPECGYTW